MPKRVAGLKAMSFNGSTTVSDRTAWPGTDPHRELGPGRAGKTTVQGWWEPASSGVRDSEVYYGVPLRRLPW